MREAQRRWRVRMLTLHAAMLAAPVVLLSLNLSPLLGTCLVRRTIGIPCPACGVTRAADALLRGRPVESVHHHPAGPLVVLALLFLVAYFLFVLAFDRNTRIEWRREVRLYTWCDVSVLAALIVGWLIKTTA